MRYWYGYTGDSLMIGHGRRIRQVVLDMQKAARLLDAANEQYAAINHRSGVPRETFVVALIAPLAMRTLGMDDPPPPTPFSSAAQVLGLFDGLDIEQAAVNLYNGRKASAYAAGDETGIAAQMAQGFANGDLLFLPRDEARLHSQDVLNALPGAVVFLLSRAQAERKAFAGYLWRGGTPVISPEIKAVIAASRPVLRTWEREARLEKERVSV